MTRCSLKELASCIALLEERHLSVLRAADLGHLKDFKIKSNINKRLICFLMYRIDPETMTLDLGGNKVLKITPKGIGKLYGLPSGDFSPPRPYDDAEALMKLKDELGIPRKQDIKTDELHKLLKNLVTDEVKDEAKDKLALKVFGLIMYNKFICPGYSYNPYFFNLFIHTSLFLSYFLIVCTILFG